MRRESAVVRVWKEGLGQVRGKSMVGRGTGKGVEGRLKCGGGVVGMSRRGEIEGK